MARPRPLVARPHDLRSPNCSSLEPPRARPILMAHASCARAMALGRPRGELGHIRRKLPSCMARSRPLLGSSARPRIHAMALVRPRPSTWCYWKGRAPAPLWPRARMSPLKCAFGLPFEGAPARWPLHLNLYAISLVSLSLSFPPFFPNSLNSKSLILPYQQSNFNSGVWIRREKQSVPCTRCTQAKRRQEMKPPRNHQPHLKHQKNPRKKPIFIDLTADSESEDTTRASSETHFSSMASCSEGHSAPC
ncbi:hypothetical protein PIB30_047000 [Stylosanthes scabra]|uniref:Uncharacterized protein n=1 Tax=Stylosanthes scabra TaxID=79078 RepID=A0ABU6XEC8_9FABA|nr:hypothetical protein [Stylosanthes scabra]